MIINDVAILLGASPFQEKMLIAECFSKEHGLIKGVVKSYSKGLNLKFQPGDTIQIIWNARLGSHLGTLKIEVIDSIYSHVFQEQYKTLFISSIMILIRKVLNELESAPYLYTLLDDFLKSIVTEHDFLVLAKNYILLGLAILDYSGFGLDLGKCVVTSRTENLRFISPKSGCAVSHDVGQPYESKLFRLPEFFTDQEKDATLVEIQDAFKIVEYFFKQRVFDNKHSVWPFACVQLGSMIKNL